MPNSFGDTYNTGTLSITNNTSVANFTGTLMTTQAEVGDMIFVNNLLLLVNAVTDDTHLGFDPEWTGGTLAGVPYTLLKWSKGRYDPALTQAKIRELLAFYEGLGLFYFVEGATPDPGIGIDGQWAIKTNDGSFTIWFHTGGVWVIQPNRPLGYGGSSTSSVTIGTGSKVFTTQAYLAYDGSRVRAASSASPTTNWLEGVASYSGTTLTITADKTSGSGTFASWLFAIAGEPGRQDLVSVVDFGASTSNTAAANTTAFQNALNTGLAIYVPPGTWPCNALTISNSKTKFYGASAAQSVLTTASANTPQITVAANLGNIEISDLGLTRSVTATTGGIGLLFAGYVDTSVVKNLEVQKQHIGIQFSSTGYSQSSNLYVHDCITDGIEMFNTVGNGNLQWYLNNLLIQGNGSRGIFVLGVVGPSQVTLGTWTNVYTFANSSFGAAFVGGASIPINGIRLNGGFYGTDGNSEIFLDTYGGQHKINNVFTELAGTLATGPGFATPASGVGSGIEISANNTDVSITGHTSNGNSLYGLRTLASNMTAISASRFANNGIYGLLLGDGTKAVYNTSTFDNNTTGPVSITSNASSIIATGNYPATTNNSMYLESVIAKASAVAVATSGVPQNVTGMTITLQPGTWEVALQAVMYDTATTVTHIYNTVSISTTSGAIDTTNGRFAARLGGSANIQNNLLPSTGGATLTIPPIKFTVPIGSTLQLFATTQCGWSGAGTPTVSGILKAQRLN